MTHANVIGGMHSKMARAVGVSLVLVLLMTSNVPEAVAGFRVKRDWSRVQIVTPGTRTTVLLYKDRAPRGKRKIKGVFHSARSDSVTLLLPRGRKQTIHKQDVRRVLVRRPFRKRYQGWIAAGASGAYTVPMVLHPGADLSPKGRLLVSALFMAAPTAFAFLVAPRMGGIYNVPRNHRKRQESGSQSAPNRKGF